MLRVSSNYSCIQFQEIQGDNAGTKYSLLERRAAQQGSPKCCLHNSFIHVILPLTVNNSFAIYLTYLMHLVTVLVLTVPQATGEKRAAPDSGKKPKTPKKKKKKDPNEPQKPVSAYALFFRDTQAAIKGQNPNATFGDVSKIVASMWDSLGEEQKQVN